MVANLAVALLIASQVIIPMKSKADNDLKQITLGYHSHVDATGKAPEKADDISPFIEKNERLLGLLKSGEYVFLFGVKPVQMTAGTSNTVLAYEKTVPTNGGYVAYGDGSVKKLTADDFKKATLAKKN